MDNADLHVLTQLHQWLQQDTSAWLCTVVQTWGSSPRPVGSLLTCNADGLVVGSLSGGCVEDDLLEKIRAGQLAADKPELHRYGIDAQESERLGLPCGGHLHVVVEPVTANRANLAQYGQIVQRLSDRQCVERRVQLGKGAVQVIDRERHQTLHFDDTHPANATLSHTYGPKYQLFLIGSGMVTQYVAEMAQALDYHVLVCDPRPEMLEQFHVEGVTRISGMPDDAVRAHASDPFSAVIALTHDPRIDDMGLMEALASKAFYVGALGSSRTSAKRRERLLMLDLSEQQIARLHAPVGLSIGSKTPAEIAIAILAELIQERKALEKQALEAAAA